MNNNDIRPSLEARNQTPERFLSVRISHGRLSCMKKYQKSEQCEWSWGRQFVGFNRNVESVRKRFIVNWILEYSNLNSIREEWLVKPQSEQLTGDVNAQNLHFHHSTATHIGGCRVSHGEQRVNMVLGTGKLWMNLSGYDCQMTCYYEFFIRQHTFAFCHSGIQRSHSPYHHMQTNVWIYQSRKINYDVKYGLSNTFDWKVVLSNK